MQLKLRDMYLMTTRLLQNSILVFIITSTSAFAGSGWLDWIPEREKLKYCDTKLTDILGAASLSVTALAASGATVTTVTSTPGLFLIAGESSLMIASGSAVTVVSTPVVGTAAAVTATAASVAYGGGKTLCMLSEFFENNYITNEDIPLVDIHKKIKFGLSDSEGFASGEYHFTQTGEIIPAGTPVFSLGPISEDAAKYYPDYDGRGLIQLGRFYDHVFTTKRTGEDRGYAVVPANSLNPILLKKYTHMFLEDTLVEKLGKSTMLPAGFPFQLLKVRKDGWAKIELSDGRNLWVENFSSVKAQELSKILK